ncbi:MAG: CdaR family protein, partial [Proteobacteria bacterium]|nr:CdaR family protein [Pseudomonadota bacterium]
MSRKKRSIISRIFSNIPIKILSLGIAIIIWYLVQGEEILEINRRLDVTFEVPPGLAIREGKSISRDVTLRGPRIALSDFSNKPIQATIRLPTGKKGALRYRLDKEIIPRWDNQIKITVHDPFVNLFVDDRASKSIPVKVTILGSTKAGISILSVKADPAEVTVTGLKTDLQKLQDIPTEVLDIGGLQDSKSFPVPLSLMGLPEFELSAQQVIVKIAVAEGVTSRMFSEIPIEVVGTDYASVLQPQNVLVTMQGTAGDVSKISSKDIHVSIDAKNLGPGRYERPLIFKAPSGNISAGLQPERAWLEIL